MRRLRLAAAVGSAVAITLGALAVACAPQPAAAPATPTADPFAVVRATSQAAYAEGKALLDRGDLRGCPSIDLAKTNDPDNRSDIQQALEQCLAALVSTPTVEPTSAPSIAQRTIVVPTIAAAQPNIAASPVAVTSPSAVAPASLQTWSDPQSRFSLSAPTDWQQVDQPQALFGSAVVEFRDGSGRANLDVAVDTSIRAVSAELYAAGMEIAMQQQVPGYALEQVVPSSTAGNPSVRRTFTFTQKDASGRELNARAFQVTVLKGSTPFIITGTAPADQFAVYSAVFDAMVDSFRFT